MNDEMNVRKINDLDVVDAIPAGSSLLINDDGTAKLLKAEVIEKALPLVVKVEVSGISADDSTATCNVPYETLKNALKNGERVALFYITVPEPEVGDTTSGNDGSFRFHQSYGNAYAWFKEVRNVKIESGTYTEIAKIGEYILIVDDDINIGIYYTPDGTLSFNEPKFELPTTD